MKASIYLKSSTQNLHRLVDRNPIMARVVSRDLTHSEYSQILLYLHTWLSKLAPSLEALLFDPVYSPSRKLKLLELDLEQLGKTPNTVDPDSFIDKPLAYSLGVHYVVEGSSLGAQFIAPRVEQSLERLDVTNFYRGYGDLVHKYWSETGRLLDATLVESHDLELAVQGASDAFELLLSIIDNEQVDLLRAS